MEQREMSKREIELLGAAISKLSEDEQEEIIGGTGNTISITNSQCNRIKEICAREDTPISQEIMSVTNYGGCCPRVAVTFLQKNEN